MKKQILLPFVLLGAAGLITSLGACQPRNQEEKPIEGYGVAITNKDALQETWYAGTSRALDIELTPAGNVMQEYTTGALKIESSNPEVVSITGANANGLTEGQATVTVKYHGWKDTVDLTISRKQTNKEKFGTVHEGTAEDPFDNEDAVKVGKWAKDNGNTEPLYVKGEIASFYHAPGSRTDGAVSWFLKPAAGQTEKFEVYKCYKEGGTSSQYFLQDSDVWVGGLATAYGPITWYADSNQAEFTGSTFVSCEGEPPAPRTTINATFAEALAAGKALDDGADSYNYYQFDAYVTKKSGTNYFLTATSGEAITDEKANTIEIYQAAAALDAKLTKNAKITIKMILKNYHGQVENLLALTADDITVVTEGGTWDVVPEPAVTNRTLAEFIAGQDTKAVAYNVTAQIKAFKDGASKDQYGNMTLTDGTNDLVVYGSSATATALAWNNADAYVFTNPKDFLTNATTSALAVGDTITMKMIRADYKGTVQGTGIITNVEGGGGGGETVPEPAVETRTLAQFIAGENTKAKAYNVTAEIKAFKSGATKDKYGNMTLTDGTNDLVVYGATMTASALAWNNADAYAFSNPQDFMTNATSNALNIGDTITMKMIRCDFTKDDVTTIEGQGIITNIESGEGGGEDTTNYGTAESPITLAQALAIVADYSKDQVTPQVVYATGKIKTAVDNSGSYIKSFTLKDATDASKELLVYSCNKNATLGDPAQNDTITICGYIKNYNGTLEFATNGTTYVTFTALTRGVSQITSTANDSTITGLINQAANNTEVQFQVAANSGYQIDAVKVYGQTLTANAGLYQFRVMGDANVVVETSVEGTVQPQLAASLNLDDKGTFDATAKTQSWSGSGISVSSATTAKKLYYSPARFYKDTTVTISYSSAISKVVLVSGQTDASKWFAGTETISNDGVLTIDGFTAEISFATPVSSFTFTCSANQVQINSVAVYVLPTA